MEVLTWMSWPWPRQTKQDLEPQTAEAWRLLRVLSLEGMRTAQSHQSPFYFQNADTSGEVTADANFSHLSVK